MSKCSRFCHWKLYYSKTPIYCAPIGHKCPARCPFGAPYTPLGAPRRPFGAPQAPPRCLLGAPLVPPRRPLGVPLPYLKIWSILGNLVPLKIQKYLNFFLKIAVRTEHAVDKINMNENFLQFGIENSTTSENEA